MNTIQILFHNSNADWVMRVTADRRIEVNKDVEVTEAAQNVLDAMQHLLGQSTRVGLTDEKIDQLGSNANA
jgi:polyphosphate kinase